LTSIVFWFLRASASRFWVSYLNFEPCLFGQLAAVFGRDDANIFALGTDQPDLWAADTVVDTRASVAGRRGVVWSAGYDRVPSSVSLVFERGR